MFLGYGESNASTANFSIEDENERREKVNLKVINLFHLTINLFHVEFIYEQNGFLPASHTNHPLTRSDNNQSIINAICYIYYTINAKTKNKRQTTRHTQDCMVVKRDRFSRDEV